MRKEGDDINKSYTTKDKLTPEQRRKNMRSIRSTNTKIERELRKALWERGYRYRKNYKGLPGHPDIAISRYKIAIFCDGDFFHGKDWELLKDRLERGKNSEFWINKIKRNQERDDEINKQLNYLGWTVIRFWETDIKNDISSCVKAIEEVIFEKKVIEND